MKKRLENTYGQIFKFLLFMMNPLKKMVYRATCEIHIFINFQALEILKNDRYMDAYTFFSDYVVDLNRGVVWADQDLKSSDHFYSPVKNRGLFGNRNAMTLAVEYYGKALEFWEEGQIEDAMFYLGAAVHLVQDVTIPQHANIRLFDQHRKYENYVRRTYLNYPKFAVVSGGYYMEGIEEFVRCNARNAIKVYDRLKKIENEEKRFYTISKFMLPMAQRTTAGCLLMFYREVTRARSDQSIRKANYL